MVNEAVIESQTASEAEIAAAAQEAAQTYQRQQPQGKVSGQAELGALKPLQYKVAPENEQSWVQVWELKVDQVGNEYGIPRMAPRQQLGLWLQKKREFDGGVRFTHTQPLRVAAEGQYPCIHQECRKKLGSRVDLVEHVRGLHDREARMYADLLDNIMKEAARDNPKVAGLLTTMATMKEPGAQSVEIAPKVSAQKKLDLAAGAPTVTHMGIQPKEPDTGCASCDWKYKDGWTERQQQQYLLMHLNAVHKGEGEG
jgi:hypothetical protein